VSGKRKQKRRGATGQAARVRRDPEGRAHLLVVEGDRLALSRPLFEEGWQDQVALGAATTAHERLAAGHTFANAAALGRTAMAATSQIADGALAQAPDRPPACRAGCAHCCHQPVGVTPPELFAIYDELRSRCAPAELAAVADRVRAADDRTRGLTPAARISPAHPCPFLEAARCTIYEVRPLACRGTNSLDADVCARNLNDPTAHAAYVAGTASVPCYREPIRAFHAVTAGLQLALDELHGLEVLPLELTAAMRVLLDDPDGVPAQWLGGKDPFAGARGGDNSDDPQMRALAGATIRP
jgi:hypothetical protein